MFRIASLYICIHSARGLTVTAHPSGGAHTTAEARSWSCVIPGMASACAEKSAKPCSTAIISTESSPETYTPSGSG